MFKRTSFLILLLGLSLVFQSCAKEYRRMTKTKKYDEKFEYALKCYDEKKYDRALPLFEEIIASGTFRGTDNAEKLYYHYAHCQYKIKDYYLAAYYFKSFAKTFPGSIYAEECLFMSAMCNVRNSPNWSLDQAETRNAINELQAFLNRYPLSERRDSCNKVIDKMNAKLEKKAYENAYLYYKIENYKAASVSLKAMLEEFPNTPYLEKTLYYIVKSDYYLAKNSIDLKKLARFEETVKSYVNFVARFPDSTYRSEIEGIYKSCLSEMEVLKKIKS